MKSVRWSWVWRCVSPAVSAVFCAWLYLFFVQPLQLNDGAAEITRIKNMHLAHENAKLKRALVWRTAQKDELEYLIDRLGLQTAIAETAINVAADTW